ncbi:alpha/beta fold hydrolase [Pectobacterium sp. B1J-3]|uniref:alpha/beta fold hydrolase n=1 Tax=Pectobacterium sp. B1J-3 TaxID=3385371 RepID=UPI0039058493
MASFNHVSGQYLQVEESRIYYEVAGDRSKQPLLLLHGGLGSLTDFNSIMSQLPPQFYFIGIDLRGHGKSTLGTLPLTYQRYQHDVEAVLTHLGITSCSVLGFSDGGIVAYRMAAAQSVKIDKLITVGAQFQLDRNGPVFEMLSGLTADMWQQMDPESVDAYKAVNPEPDFDTLVNAVVGLWTDTATSGYPGQQIRQITAPLLLIRGDHDHLLSLEEVSALRQQLPQTHFFNIPFAEHEVHKDAPELFLKVVNDFLLAKDID